ncbi:hypothetical protein V502_08222 [Pseudogymnoascus sp. VKM F-4520 (FW-2644)]|nr:hypothetical protein V502_08222 [Pseudogymnoascus sp. VKM F-4520 (FW-2644)]
MSVYLSVPILDEVVRSVEDDPTSEAVKAMASGILSYYFPPVNGYVVALEHNRNDYIEDLIIFRIRRRFPGERITVDHTFVEVKGPTDPAEQSLDPLRGALDQSNTEFGRCWAMIIQKTNFKFYEYHSNLPVDNRLVPRGAPNQEQSRNSFHVRNDSVIIDWMLRHMIEFNIPLAHLEA